MYNLPSVVEVQEALNKDTVTGEFILPSGVRAEMLLKLTGRTLLTKAALKEWNMIFNKVTGPICHNWVQCPVNDEWRHSSTY